MNEANLLQIIEPKLRRSGFSREVRNMISEDGEMGANGLGRDVANNMLLPQF